MYANGEGLAAPVCKSSTNETRNGRDDIRKYFNGKRFVRCICPRCQKEFNAYLKWSGRGTPRKYCADCKAIIGNYDESAMYETSSAIMAQVKKRGHSAFED